MITALVIDDEPYSCEALVELLTKYCPEVQVAKVCHSGAEALIAIKEHSPQLLFLDIEMPRMNGFELLEKAGEINFELIFTTSYDQYAIKAIRMSALDYLLKPIDRVELQKAVQKVKHRLVRPQTQQIEMLLQKLSNPATPMLRIALPTMEGLQLVQIDSVICCTSDSNYTTFSLKGKEKIIVSKTLKEVEELLNEYSFLRVHHSSLVNLNEISKYVKGEGGYLVMSDASHVDVSRSRKEMLMRKLQPAKF
ncbi:MAG: LytTR family DNA-binding domain-containing protein [Cyclobacteriaceae bacterium]